MKQPVTVATVLTAAVLMTACGGSGNPVQPSLLRPAGPSATANPTQSDGARPPEAGVTNLGPLQPASCSIVTNGVDVVVDGSGQDSGTLLAATVALVPEGTQPAPAGGVVGTPGSSGPPAGGSFAAGDALGKVANLRGSCPNLTFTVQGRDVTTNSATTFYDWSTRRR